MLLAFCSVSSWQMPPARVIFYSATLGVLVLSARAVLASPPPLGVSLALLVGYFGLIIVGVLWLGLRVFADAVTRGPAGARGVALTFDDGPDPVFTPQVLDALDGAKVRATFFLIGRKAEANPEIVRDIVRRGHDVGLHSYAHDRLFAMRSPRRVRADLERGIRVLEQITGRRPEMFRPPIGHTNPGIVRVVDELDLAIVGWSVSGRDGLRGVLPEAVVARVRSGLKDGAIVLLHDSAERGDHDPAGVFALPAILTAIKELRLEVVPLQTWL